MKLKNVAAGCMAAVMVLSMAACGGKENEKDSKAVQAIPTPTETTADTTESVVDDTQTDEDSSFVSTVIMPEGFYQNSEGEWVQGENSLVSDSKAPAQQTIKISTDWTDLEFVFDNTLIKCGETKFGELMDKGWYEVVYEDTVFLGTYYPDFEIGKNPYYYTYPNGSPSNGIPVATVDLWNPDNELIPYNDVFISGFLCDATANLLSGQDYPIVYISGGITFNASVDDVFTAFGQPDKTEHLDPFEYEPSTNYSTDSKAVTNEYKNYDKTKIVYTSNDRELTFIIADNKVTGIGMKKVVE